MRSIRINFVKSRLYRRLWWFTGTVITTTAIAAVAQWIVAERADSYLRKEIADMESKLAAFARPTDVKPNGRFESSRAAIGFLQADLNVVFNTMENLQISGSRLLNFSFNLADDQARLEYQVERLSQVSDISSYLNDGYKERPWQLQSAVSSESPNSLTGEKLTAVWLASISSLINP